tara:strand:+ start:1223 stop:1573 length:351 start_codon:yes stop_codon:yes gene_type:complete
MASFKGIKQLATNPLVGVVTTALKPTPLGAAYTVANVATKAMTGKTIPQYLKGTIKGPATGSSNKVGPNRKGDKTITGSIHRDPEQKNILKDRKAKGGLVTYKNVQDMDNKSYGKR